MKPTLQTSNMKPFNRSAKSTALKIVLIVVGLIFMISCGSLIIYDISSPKISGDFTVKTCNGSYNGVSKGAANQNLCSGTFMTSDSKVSFDESNVVTPGLPSSAEGKIFTAYAVGNNEHSLSSSSQLFVGSNGLLGAFVSAAVGFFLGLVLVFLSIIFWIKPIRPQAK